MATINSIKSLTLLKGALRTRGINIDKKHLTKVEHQGLAMKTFFARSNIGDLVVQIGKIHDAERQWKPWMRITSVGNVLGGRMLPVPKIFLAGATKDEYFTVQEKIAGRILNSNEPLSLKLMRDMEKLIAKIHAIHLSGAGPIVGKGTRGKYKNWTDFLAHDIPKWLKRIRKVEGDAVLVKGIWAYYEKHKKDFAIKQPCLVHGDLLNFSNVIVAKGRIVGIVDWEFAMIGDPAWEFCGGKKYGLRTYFTTRRMSPLQRRKFEKRAKIYRPLFLARVMSLNNSKSEEYISSRRQLKELLPT